jgi:hypothetical protein
MTEPSRVDPVRSAQAPDAPLSRRRGIVTGVVVVLVGLVALAANFLSDEPPRRPRPRDRGADTPVAGTTCPLLARAAELLDAGDEVGFQEAVRDASRSALRTLDRSGQTFGAPERAAVQLGYDVGSGDTAAITEGLVRAERACSELDRWPTV